MRAVSTSLMLRQYREGDTLTGQYELWVGYAVLRIYRALEPWSRFNDCIIKIAGIMPANSSLRSTQLLTLWAEMRGAPAHSNLLNRLAASGTGLAGSPVGTQAAFEVA